MGHETRYKRDTWKKNQLRDSMNTPRYGTNACHLCERGRIPDDLTVKVTKYKTCGDIHLELSLLAPDQSSCATGQEAYRELCCPTNKSFQFPQMPKPNKPLISVAAGLLLFWLYTRRIRRRVHSAPDNDGDDERHNEHSKASKYQRMKDDQSNGSGSRKKGKSPSRSRSKSRERGMSRPRSKDSSSKDNAAGTKKREPAIVIKPFKPRNKETTNVSNVLQQQQRRIQQQYNKTNHVQSDDEYYRFDDDTLYNDSTLGGHDTVAGESMDAVITQVV